MKNSRKRDSAQPETAPHARISRQAPHRRNVLAMLALCAVTLLAYANSFTAGFTFDNKGLLLLDPRIRQFTLENLGQIFQHTYWWPYGESGLYRPFTTLTYLFNYAILGDGEHAAGYHCVNFLLHAGNVLVLFALMRRLIREFWPPVFVAALWAVHPVLTESVTNMVGRADLLAGMSLLGGLLMYLKSTESQGMRRWVWLAGLTAALVAGMFSKENAAVIPGVIALYELTWWKERRQARGLLLGSAAGALALGAMAFRRAAVFAALPSPDFPFWDNPLLGADFWTARLTAIRIMAKYLGLLVWPAQLSSDYSYAQIPMATGGVRDWLGWMVVAAVALAAVAMFRYNRIVFFVAGMAFLTFLPSSNLLFPIGTIMAERFLYIPAIAAAVCIVLGAYALSRRIGAAQAAPAVLCLLVTAFATRTWFRNADWQDDMSLATATVRTSPASFKSHKILASAMASADASHSNIDQVIAEAEKGLAIIDGLPGARQDPDVFRRLGNYYMLKGDQLLSPGPDGEPAPTPQSLQAYRRALELLLHCRSVLAAASEQTAAIERALGHAVPERDHAQISVLEQAISATYLRVSDPQAAIDAARRAQSEDPLDNGPYRLLAMSYAAAGRPDDAAVALMQGTLVKKDIDLRRQLIELYQHGLDTEGCATKPGGALNPACGIVHRHLCAASKATFAAYRRAGREDLVKELQTYALRDFGCSAGDLNPAPADSAPRVP